jgi:arylsulfatase A-like enzyme
MRTSLTSKNRIASSWRVLLAPFTWLLTLVAVVWILDFVRIRVATDQSLAEHLAASFISLGNMLQVVFVFGGLITVVAAVTVLAGRMNAARPAPLPVLVLSLLPLLGWVGLDRWPTRSSSADGTDVYLIVVDTLRSDFVDARRTPNLWALGQDGIRFTDAVSTSSWTLPAFGSLLTGQHSAEHQLGDEDGVGSYEAALDSETPTLAEHLRAAGYQTTGLVTNSMLRADLGLSRGFDHYLNLVPLTATTLMTWRPFDPQPYARGPVQTQRGRWWLNAGADPARPLFMLLHFMDPHAPHTARGASVRAERTLDSEARAELVVTYGAEVRGVDAAVGEFLDHLRSAGRYESALIVFLSDHGEELDEARPVEAQMHRPRHGHSHYPEVARIPLVVKLPGGVGAGTESDELVSLLDVPETVIEVLGLPPLPGARGVPVVDASGRLLPPADVAYQGALLHGPERDVSRTDTSAVVWNRSASTWPGSTRIGRGAKG